MNTTDSNSNSNQQSLQELQQRKQAIKRKRKKWTDIFFALLFGPFVLGYILSYFLTEDTVTRTMGILFMILFLFTGYYVVKTTKWTWAINDIDREIKNVDKTQSDISKKENPESWFSTHHATRDEKVAKALGAVILAMALILLALETLATFDLFAFELPQSFKANYPIIIFAPLWVGQTMLRYRFDLSLVSRISLWSSVLLLLASMPLLYFESVIGDLMLFVSMVIGVINLFIVDKDLFYPSKAA